MRDDSAAPPYEPGVCNIGEAEVRLRWILGHAGVVFTLGLLALLIALDAPSLARLVLALPAAGTAFSYLEARSRFCGSYGLRGVYNFARLGSTQRIADATARRADRRRALQMTALAALAGLAAGLTATLLPV